MAAAPVAESSPALPLVAVAAAAVLTAAVVVAIAPIGLTVADAVSLFRHAALMTPTQ
jgi:hypothetical protein